MNRGSGKFRVGAGFSGLLILASCLHNFASGATLLQDDFNYPDGPLTSVAGTIWSTHSGNAHEASVAMSQLHLNGTNTEDVNALLSGQPYAAGGATNRFYASFTIRVTALPSTGGTYFAHFKGSSTTAFAGRIWAFTGEASPGKFRIGVSSTSGSIVSAVLPIDLNLNTDYLVVTRLETQNSVTRLWINPAAESDSAIVSGEPAAGFNLVAYAFRQATGLGALNIDDLRVGTRFTDVVPGAVPEQGPILLTQPENQEAFELGIASFRAEVQADPTPAFQWRFQGTNLPAATNASLILSNVTFAHAGFYSVLVSNAIDSIASTGVTLNVLSPSAPAFSILNYNLHGNGVLNWSTNTFHIRAIGRVVQYLDPDILTLQEIPVTNSGTAQMENFVKAFRPGFHLATNSSDDMYIRSVILSRFPVVTSRSWLHGSDLAPFGYVGSGFTRDLFEAEISVPGFPQPLHVFTVHLKSGQDNDSATKRSAEAAAISNFLAVNFLGTNSLRPYLLTGDFNEDILRPPASDPRSVQKLANAATGLHLTTPFNPISGGELTFNMQSADGLSRRYDYVLPSGLLWSNTVRMEVFRSDLLNPLPANLFSNDTRTASDHLPVFLKFSNPYTKPMQLTFTAADNRLELLWPAVPGQTYHVESSSNLTVWTPLGESVLATNSRVLFHSRAPGKDQFFRVRRQP